MHDLATRRSAAAMRAEGRSWSQISRLLGVSRSTLRAWEARGPVARASDCACCDDVALDQSSYAALLGFYLGDGCISRHARYYALRVSCDASLPAIIADVSACMSAVRPAARIFHVPAPGAVVVSSNWQHWPCLFPQHGPGRKHERTIVLEDWQRAVVETRPGPFLRGLFHSDGCRARNWTRRRVAGEWKRYDHPRWQFTNVSADIRELCCWALDLAEVRWRQSSWNCVSVSRRADVARLDALIGMKQ
ncbi:helix-turn-helix domain-containing protein [Nocardioides sp. C4-1]|uniref:helix-turn-helix domain-containing protein n=1 Tax=Nocardioides sp. C4-1 TaxID=3151851 RepID=UPI003265B094